MAPITVATTLTTYAMAERDTWASWLLNAEAIAESNDVVFFAAIEIDGRGTKPFLPLLERLAELNGEWWFYLLDDGRDTITTSNRQIHLATGENLASAFATNIGSEHLLFCAADCAPPADVLPKLLEVRSGVVGAEVPTYGLHGPDVPGYGFPVQRQLASAACVLLERKVFKQLKWRADPDLGLTDDPALKHDAKTLLGIDSLVRKDCVATHYPVAIGPIESRYEGRDMSVESIR